MEALPVAEAVRREAAARSDIPDAPIPRISARIRLEHGAPRDCAHLMTTVVARALLSRPLTAGVWQNMLRWVELYARAVATVPGASLSADLDALGQLFPSDASAAPIAGAVVVVVPAQTIAVLRTPVDTVCFAVDGDELAMTHLCAGDPLPVGEWHVFTAS